MSPVDTFSFGSFKFEPRSGRLTKHGYKVKLQPRVAAALSCLLERQGEVVTRAQLRAKLWTEGTYVDFDLGIKIAVKKLRDALGDDSEEPVYIQTVHGEGYRFIAPVQSTLALEPNGLAVSQQDSASKPQVVRRGTYWWGAAAALVALIILALGLRGIARRDAVNFQSRDWVVIAAFENSTGEKLLDGTMEFALERALSLSRYVNVTPRDRINDALKLMRQSPSAVLSEDLARQVAVRDGAIKAVLAGRVEKFGPKYVLTVRLLEPVRGDTIAVFEKEGPESRLPDVARLVSDELRGKLGEKANTVDAGLPLEKATTPSLAAIRAFTAGMAQVNQGHPREAVPLLEEAILEDPQFAAAHIYAAHSYSNLGQDEKGAPHYEAAFRLAPGVSQRERLFILGSYYARFLHDYRRAVDAYQALVNLYPDDYWGMNNLLYAYLRLGMDRERIEAAGRLVALRPNDPRFEILLELSDYYRLDHPDKTKAQQIHDMLRRHRASGMDPPGGTWVIVDMVLDLEVATERWVSGDVKAAAREVARVSAHARTQSDGIFKLMTAGANLALGKLAAANELCGQVTESVLRSECLLPIAWVSGNRDLLREQLPWLRSSGPSPRASPQIDLILCAWLGETAFAGPWLKFKSDPTVHGSVLLAQGRFARAAKLLQPLPLNRFSFPWTRYPLAMALERQGKREEAIAKLEEQDLPHSALSNSWTWPVYRAKLAKLCRETGRVEAAVKVEDELRHYLSEADADYPVLAQLRAASAGASLTKHSNAANPVAAQR